MILTKEVHVTDKFGEFQSHNFKISEEDAGIIMQALQEGLYKDPIGSVVREIISNAIDSHIEAKVDKNVEVEFIEHNACTGSYNCIVIRDFGTGIDPTIIADVLCSYGRSTKRKDNKAIGCFGVGSKSVFAYTSSYYVQNRWNGKEYLYFVYKDTDTDKFDLFAEATTDKHNGIEVIIPLKDKYDLTNFQKAITRQLRFVTGITYINMSVDLPVILANADLYAILDNQNNLTASVGGILYPIETNEVATYKAALYDKLKHFNQEYNRQFIIKVNIGDVDITLSREALRYTKKTLDAIELKVDDIVESMIKEYSDFKNTETEFNRIFRYYLFRDANSTSNKVNRIRNIIKILISFEKFKDNFYCNSEYSAFCNLQHNIYYTNERTCSHKHQIRFPSFNNQYAYTENLPLLFIRSFENTRKYQCVADAHDTIFVNIVLSAKPVMVIFADEEEAKMLKEEYKVEFTELINRQDYPEIFIRPKRASKKANGIFVRECEIPSGQQYLTFSNKYLTELPYNFIYGDNNQDELLKLVCACCLKLDVRKPVLKMSKSINIDEQTHVLEYLSSMPEILKRFCTAAIIKERIEKLAALQYFSFAFPEIYRKYAFLRDYVDEYMNTMRLLEEQKTLIIKHLKALGAVNKQIISLVEELETFCTGIELINYLDVPKYFNHDFVKFSQALREYVIKTKIKANECKPHFQSELHCK